MKAKTQGKLELPTVTSALRSCFPQYRAGAKAKKPVATLLVDDENIDEVSEDGDPETFADVEAFLADNNLDDHVGDDELQEQDAAEALAVSWKERRREISKLQQSRRFGAATAARKSLRVEIEELKRRTRCRRCGKLGHWAKEFRAPVQGKPRHADSGQSGASSSQHHVSDVNLVQDEASFDHEITFVGMIENLYTQSSSEVCTAGLVSSPGYGVVDSGCGRTLIGQETLLALTQKLATRTKLVPVEYH